MRGECFKTEYLTGQQSCHEKQTQTLKTHSSWAFGKKQVLQLTLEMEGEPSSPIVFPSTSLPTLLTYEIPTKWAQPSSLVGYTRDPTATMCCLPTMCF